MNLNKQFTILLASCIALLSMGVSCKDKNKKSYCEENPGECKTVLVAKDFFYFKQGSWWVYEEETSHERDSMYVYESINDLNSYYFSIRVHSQLQDYNYHYWPVYMSAIGQCSPTESIQAKCLYIKKSKGKPDDFVAEENCFYINYRIGTTSSEYSDPNYCDKNYIRVESVSSVYSIGNVDFGETVKIYEYCSPFDNHQSVNCFYSKGVGLTRKELIDSNQVWNLVNYHIES